MPSRSAPQPHRRQSPWREPPFAASPDALVVFRAAFLQRFSRFPQNLASQFSCSEVNSWNRFSSPCKVTFLRQKEKKKKKHTPLLELLPARHKKIHSHPPFFPLLLSFIFFCHWAQGDRHKTITDTQTHTERNPCAHLCKHVHWQPHTSTCSLQRSDRPVILLPKGK